MRVICIDDHSIKAESMIGLIKAGYNYTVTGNSTNYPDHFYLQEIPLDRDGIKCSWHKRHFAECSEIDEKDLSHAEPIESTFILKEHV